MKSVKKNFQTTIDILVMISFLAPYFPTTIYPSWIGSIFKYYQLFIYTAILITMLRKRMRAIKAEHLLLVSLYLIPILSTIIHGNYALVIKGFRVLLGSFVFVSYFSYRLNGPNSSFIQNMLKLLTCIVLVNAATMFIFTENGFSGSPAFYFLGNDNGSIFESSTMAFYLVILDYGRFKKIKYRTILVLLFVLGAYLYKGAANAEVGILLILISIALVRGCFIKKALNKKTLGITYLVLLVVIVLWRGETNILTIILNLLGKDSTYTGRTIIWEKMLPYIRSHIFLGNGYEGSASQIAKFGHIKAHNLIIQTLYDGGITQLLILLLTYRHLSKKIEKIEDENMKRLLCSFVFIFGIITLFDYYPLVKYSLAYLLMMPDAAKSILNNSRIEAKEEK